MRCQREKIRQKLIDILREYFSIDDIPRKIVENAVIEICSTMCDVDDSMLQKYVQNILIPEVHKVKYENMSRYKNSFGWGQVKKLLPYILSDSLLRLKFTVYVRPFVNATRVDLIVESYGKYLPILISTGVKEKLVRYKVSRLRASGVNAQMIEIRRHVVLGSENVLSMIDVDYIEYLIDKFGHVGLKFHVDRYEQTLFEIWREYVHRGYIVFKNYLLDNYMLDLFAVGYCKVGVKKFTRSLMQTAQQYKESVNKIVDLLSTQQIDKMIIVAPFEHYDRVKSDFERKLGSTCSDYVKIVYV